MGHPNYDLVMASNDLARISAWIDNHNGGTFDLNSDAGLARAWGRTSKISEEVMEVQGAGGSDVVVSALAGAQGRVVTALIGATGQNPRKGVTHTEDDVVKELCDVALTALAAVESITGNRGESMTLFRDHIRGVERRMAESRYRHGEPGGVPATKGPFFDPPIPEPTGYGAETEPPAGAAGYDGEPAETVAAE
jgi:hypothetical protein